jgi:hypothetical protein
MKLIYDALRTAKEAGRSPESKIMKAAWGRVLAGWIFTH